MTTATAADRRNHDAQAGIYFILCPSYHGATLLSLLLNNHSDVLCLGDTNPTRSFDQSCACGDMVSTCQFWTRVGALADPLEVSRLPNLLPQYPYIVRGTTLNQGLNTAFSLAANVLGKGVWRLGGKAPQQFHDTYERFLSICQSWAPHRVFVDGEKSLVKFMAAASLGFPVKGVIHMTRDPRGFMHSARKYLPDWTTHKIITAWTQQHGRILRLGTRFAAVPSIRIRYEDLADRPGEVMADVFRFLGLPDQHVISAPNSARKHHLIGNDMLRTFDGTVRPDRTWRDTMSAADGEFALKHAGKLAAAFGYGDDT